MKRLLPIKQSVLNQQVYHVEPRNHFGHSFVNVSGRNEAKNRTIFVLETSCGNSNLHSKFEVDLQIDRINTPIWLNIALVEVLMLSIVKH